MYTIIQNSSFSISIWSR